MTLKGLYISCHYKSAYTLVITIITSACDVLGFVTDDIKCFSVSFYFRHFLIPLNWLYDVCAVFRNPKQHCPAPTQLTVNIQFPVDQV